MKVKSSKIIPTSEAHKILTKRSEDGELGYEQSQALDHSAKRPETSKKLLDALMENGKIDEELAVKLADIRPKTPATVRAILVKNKIDMSEEEIVAILKELA